MAAKTGFDYAPGSSALSRYLPHSHLTPEVNLQTVQVVREEHCW